MERQWAGGTQACGQLRWAGSHLSSGNERQSKVKERQCNGSRRQCQAAQRHHKGSAKAGSATAAQRPPVLRPPAVEQDVLQPARRHGVQTVRQPPRTFAADERKNINAFMLLFKIKIC